jgi:glutamyl-tRNA synthetase
MLHIGSARVALYCWLFARRHQGEYILRIEDTDRERSTQEAVDVILDGLAWLGIDHDTGPIFQSQRDSLYATYLQKLLDTNQAYYCNCSKQRLDDLRAEQMANKQKPKYDHHCRGLNLPAGDDTVVRFANPIDGVVSFQDAVLGGITISNKELDDFIIARADGSPTYNFTVVVDDIEMQISHVIRGNDHVNNTPRQINLMQALGVTPPVYAHLPLILGDDGKKLSKRHGALSVLEYQKQGYLPHALLNYLLRLGWSHGDDEIFSQADMMRLFDLEHINKSPARFDSKKSLWLNQHYIKQASPNDLVPAVKQLAKELQRDYSQGPDLTAVIAALQERAKTLVELVEKSAFWSSRRSVWTS